MSASDWEIANAMSMYGGSFAQALASACRHADPENLATIKTAFPEMWREYKELAARHKARLELDALAEGTS